MAASRVSRVNSQMNVRSILTRSIVSERNSVSDECPVPKSSSATLTPSARAAAISTRGRGDVGQHRGLGDLEPDEVRVATRALEQLGEPLRGHARG